MIGRILFNRMMPAVLQRARQANMSTNSSLIQYKQDLPPPGGYKAFEWERIPSEKPLIGPFQIFIYLSMVVYGYFALQFERRRIRGEKLEILDAKIALMPLLTAERDRLYLKRVRRNYEEECRLMKDVPGWEPGHWFDQPIYRTLPKGMWLDPAGYEFWAHTDPHLYEQFYHWWWSA